MSRRLDCSIQSHRWRVPARLSAGEFTRSGAFADMTEPRRGTTEVPDQGLDVFLNDNVWLATAFAFAFVAAAAGLLFLLAWLEPSGPPPSRAPVATGVDRARPGRSPA